MFLDQAMHNRESPPCPLPHLFGGEKRNYPDYLVWPWGDATMGGPTWWSIPVKGGNMKRVNLTQYYVFGSVIHRLMAFPSTEEKPIDYYVTIIQSISWIRSFLDDEMIPMPISKKPANRLKEALVSLQSKIDLELSTEKHFATKYSDEILRVNHAAKMFATVFLGELSEVRTYFVSQKRAYDTKALIESAETIFSETTWDGLPEKARDDIREAGKCLAFDLGTATGFHLTRAVESVVLQYLTILCPQKLGSLKSSEKNLGGYISLAKAHGGHEEICATLDQFRALHRNPLIHPEESLSVDEALNMLGIAQSAIARIMRDIDERKTQALKRFMRPD